MRDSYGRVLVHQQSQLLLPLHQPRALLAQPLRLLSHRFQELTLERLHTHVEGATRTWTRDDSRSGR